MKIVLLFGGESEERLVSVATAQNLSQSFAFDSILFWSPEGEIFTESLDDLKNHKDPFTKNYVPKGTKIANSWTDSKFLTSCKGQLIFLGLHGGDAENGQLQKLLEENQIKFTGSSSMASHLAFDKSLAKLAISKAGGRVPFGILLDLKAQQDWKIQLSDFYNRYNHIVIKPNASGSSFGLHFVSDQASLDKAIGEMEVSKNQFFNYLCEERIMGRELTNCYVENNHFVLPASEVLLEADHQFDYQGKYLGVGTKEVTPARISKEQQALANQLAELAHKAVGAFGYSRTDMILTEKNEMVFIEINTLPGMTKASFVPQQLDAKGISVAQFIEYQVALSSK